MCEGKAVHAVHAGGRAPVEREGQWRGEATRPVGSKATLASQGEGGFEPKELRAARQLRRQRRAAGRERWGDQTAARAHVCGPVRRVSVTEAGPTSCEKPPVGQCARGCAKGVQRLVPDSLCEWPAIPKPRRAATPKPPVTVAGHTETTVAGHTETTYGMHEIHGAEHRRRIEMWRRL